LQDYSFTRKGSGLMDTGHVGYDRKVSYHGCIGQPLVISL